MIGKFYSFLFHLFIFSYVYMNSIKACVVIGKKSPSPSSICASLMRAIETTDASLMPRYVEIFDELLSFFKDQSSFAEWSKKASIVFTKLINDSRFETRCSIITFYNNLLMNDPKTFLNNQEQIWSVFDLEHKNFSDTNIEAEGTLE